MNQKIYSRILDAKKLCFAFVVFFCSTSFSEFRIEDTTKYNCEKLQSLMWQNKDQASVEISDGERSSTVYLNCNRAYQVCRGTLENPDAEDVFCAATPSVWEAKDRSECRVGATFFIHNNPDWDPDCRQN